MIWNSSYKGPASERGEVLLVEEIQDKTKLRNEIQTLQAQK